MSDHKHEWITETLDNQTCYAYCNIRGCDAQLSYKEIEHRLNAYEARITTVKRIPPDLLPSDKGGLAQKVQEND